MNISISKNNIIFVLGTVFLAVLFRYPALYSHSLWADEVSIWLAARLPTLSEMLDYHTLHDLNPPGYPILNYLYSKLLYNNITTDWVVILRSFTFLGNILAIATTCFIAIELNLSKYSKVLLAIAVILNYQLIFFSHEARAYSWMICFCQISLLAYLQFTQEMDLAPFQLKSFFKRKSLWYLLLSLTLLAYSHYFGTFAVFCLGMHYLFSEKITKNRFVIFFVTFGLSFVFFLPQLYVALKKVSTTGSLWIHEPHLADFFTYLRYYFGGASLTVIICVAVIILAIWKFQLMQKSSKHISLFAAVLLGVFLVGYIVSKVYIPMMYNRYMIIGLIPFLLIFILAFDKIIISLNFKKRQIFFSILVFYFLAQGINTLFIKRQFYTTPKNEQLKEASEYILENKGTGPAIVITNRSQKADGFYFENAKALDITVVELRNYVFKPEDLNKKIYLMEFSTYNTTKATLPNELDLESTKHFNVLQVSNLKLKTEVSNSKDNEYGK